MQGRRGLCRGCFGEWWELLARLQIWKCFRMVRGAGFGGSLISYSVNTDMAATAACCSTFVEDCHDLRREIEGVECVRPRQTNCEGLNTSKVVKGKTAAFYKHLQPRRPVLTAPALLHTTDTIPPSN